VNPTPTRLRVPWSPALGEPGDHEPRATLQRPSTPPHPLVLTSTQTVNTLKNQLYYGDNYEVLQRYVKDETVDLVYLDPPFNSRQDYNVLFAEKDGSQSSSQIHAFEDTWEWNLEAQRAYEQIVEQGGRVADALRAFKTFLFNSDMMAYLATNSSQRKASYGAMPTRTSGTAGTPRPSRIRLYNSPS